MIIQLSKITKIDHISRRICLEFNLKDMKKTLLVLALFFLGFEAIEQKFVLRAELKSAGTETLKPELILQTGHSKSVQAVIVSPDNRWVASGSFDNTVKIWEVETGRELRALNGHHGTVRALACSPDGRRLASGGNDKTVRIWEVETGQEVKKFDLADGTIESLAFSPDGNSLAVGTSGNSITILEFSGGRELFKFSEHTAAVTALVFSPDGRSLASGSADGSVKLWDLSKGRRIKNLKNQNGAIKILQFNKTAELLAAGGTDKSIHIWKNPSGREDAVLNGHTGNVLALKFSDDGKLLSADSNHLIKHWDLLTRKELNSVSGRFDGNSLIEEETAVFGIDGKFVAYGSGDRTVRLFDTKNGEQLKNLESQTTGYYGVAFSSDRRWLSAAAFDNSVKLWDLQTGQSLPPLNGHNGFVTAVVFHPDNRTIISASVDHSIRLWDAISKKPLAVLKGHTNSVSAIGVSASGNLIVSGSLDKTVGLWSFETKTRIGVLNGHSGEVISAAISPDEKIIASASSDKTIKLWDVRTQTLIRTLEAHSEEVDTIAFSPDSRTLVSGSLDKTIRIWEVATGNLRQTIDGHAGKINSVVFSPDGSRIVTGGQDQAIKIWNLSDGQPAGVLKGHSGAVFSLSFSNDGQWLASASEDGSLIIWDSRTGEQKATLVSLKSSDDWLVVSPQGFFDGSPAAWEQLFWRFEKNTFNVKTVEVFFNEFYSPGFLNDLLSGKKLPSTKDISAKDRRQPKLEISLGAGEKGDEILTERQVKVKVKASEVPSGNGFQSGSGVRDIRLFRNGSLVKFWSGNLLKNSGNVELETTVSLVNGQNQLTAYGFNNENIKSDNARLIVKGADKLKRKGVFYIIAVGVGKYINPKYNLSYVELDAKEFGNLLRVKQAELKNFDRIEIVSLYNEEATKSNILSAIGRLAGNEPPGANRKLPSVIEKLEPAQPEDTVSIFFSGHGTSQNGHFYILPYDLGYTDPEQPLDAELMKTVLAHSISDVELEESFREIDAGHLLLVIDACNSGQLLESEDDRRGPMNTKGLAQLAYDKGMYILTASQSIELAYVSQALKRSYLSYALTVEGLTTPVADTYPTDGLISVREWFDYATNRVPQLRQNTDGIPSATEQGKGLEEEEEIKQKGSQRPRVFYRRQNDLNSLIISQVR